MSDKPSQEQFVKDVSKHEMATHTDNGVYRHLTFRAPDTFACGFHVTTWPGYLAFSGDMGTFVFSRLPDMFEFFRTDRDINPGYWAEKLTAHDKHGGHLEFSEDLYHDALRSRFRQWDFENWRQMRRAWADVRDEIWNPDNLQDAVGGAYRYRCSETGHEFQDIWDHNLEDYTYRFIWCCRAIVWAIAQYDSVKAANDNAALQNAA